MLYSSLSQNDRLLIAREAYRRAGFLDPNMVTPEVVQKIDWNAVEQKIKTTPDAAVGLYDAFNPMLLSGLDTLETRIKQGLNQVDVGKYQGVKIDRERLSEYHRRWENNPAPLIKSFGPDDERVKRVLEANSVIVGKKLGELLHEYQAKTAKPEDWARFQGLIDASDSKSKFSHESDKRQ